jgi:hypothetical protein
MNDLKSGTDKPDSKLESGLFVPPFMARKLVNLN